MTTPSEDPPAKRRRFNWKRLTMWLLLLGIALFFTWPIIMKQRKAADRTQAISHLKGIGLAMLEYEQEFGSFPHEQTVGKLTDALIDPPDLSGSSSNSMFRQLVAFGIQSEIIFYCVHPEGIHKPDSDISLGKALEAGEVGYSYVAGLNTKMNPRIPVAMAPMKIGTESFWSAPYDGKAAVLSLDNSVEGLLIRNSDGKVEVGNGKTLFDTGEGTLWPAGHVVDLRHPEPGP